MKALKRIAVFLIIAIFCLSAVSCKEELTDNNGLASGSIDITTENLPKIITTENYAYLAQSLAAALLRVDADTDIGTQGEPKTAADFIITVETAEECYKALETAQADMAICFEPQKSALDALTDVGITLKSIPLGAEELIFFTGPDCGVTELTDEQLLSVFNGTVTNWKDLGGADLEISAFLPETDSYEYKWFTSHFGALETTPKKPVDIYSTHEGIFTAPAGYDNRSGAVSFALRSDFSVTSLGGTKTLLTLKDSEQNPLALKRNIVISVTSRSAPDSVTSLVFDWLSTEQGAILLKALSDEIAK